MTSVDHKKIEETDSHLLKYVRKNVELEVIEEVLSENCDILQRKKEALKEEYKELDNINYSVWTVEDKYCDEIWNFSAGHDFHDLFKQYHNTNNKEIGTSRNCEHDTAMVDHMEETDIDKKDELIKLKNEIDIINDEIIDIRNKNIEQDLKDAISILDNLKSLSDEISELIRLIDTQENCLDICNVPMYQELNGNVAEGFVNARELFEKSNFQTQVLIEKETISNTVTKKTEECYSVHGNVKFGKFIMKKRSHISLKFENSIRNST